MKAQVAFTSEAGPVRTSNRQRGFTVVSTAVSFTVAAVVLTGAWIAYRDMQAHMHVNQADRQMDQYAHAAMQDLSNRISWAWGAKEIQGGHRNTRWNFMIKDEVNEQGTWIPDWPLEPGGWTQVRFQPTRGLLFGSVPPRWAEDRYQRSYVWTGRAPGRGKVNMMDRRDRMTMESLIIGYEEPRLDLADVKEKRLAKFGSVSVELTLQYRYRANAVMGIYPGEYVRERTYRTSVYCRNYWSDLNKPLRQELSGETEGAAGS